MTKLDQIKNDIKTLTESEKQELQQFLSNLGKDDKPKKSIIGIWKDHSDLVDEIVKEAYQMRRAERVKDV
jgi:hypothetical protein